MHQIAPNEIPLQPDIGPPTEQPGRPGPDPVRNPYNPSDPDQPSFPSPAIGDPQGDPPKTIC